MTCKVLMFFIPPGIITENFRQIEQELLSYAIICQTSYARHRLQHFFQTSKVQAFVVSCCIPRFYLRFTKMFPIPSCISSEILSHSIKLLVLWRCISNHHARPRLQHFFENSYCIFLDHKAHLKSFNFLKNAKCAL